MSELKVAKKRFDSMDSGIKEASIVTREIDGREVRVLRVSFDAEPYRYSESIQSIRKDQNLKNVDTEGRELNHDKMPILYFAEFRDENKSSL